MREKKITIGTKTVTRIVILFVWIAMVISVAFGLGTINWFRYYELKLNGIKTLGVITAKEPNNHQTIRYSFSVNNTKYIGAQSSSNLMDKIEQGDNISVTYLQTDPNKSCIENPKDLLENETISIGIATVMVPTLLLLGLRSQYRRWKKNNTNTDAA